MSALVTVEEIRAAARRLDGVVVRTPLVPFPDTEPRLLVKPESLQPTGSFKLRGAFSAISALTAEQRAKGVVAHSSGNHGLAVAYAAETLGVPAVVVVPHNAAQVKVAAAARHGARIVTVEPTLEARIAGAQEQIDQHGYALIPPFDHRDVIAGQGTIGLEIAADRPDADLVLVPISGGGLISGIAAAVCAASPGAKVIGVEPELAADARDSLRRGEQVAWPASATGRTIADALRVEQIGALPLRHILGLVHDIVTVTEDEIREAVRLTATRARLVAEPGGAVAVAAWLFRRDLPSARAPVAVLSGGNIAPALLAGILAGPAGPEPRPGAAVQDAPHPAGRMP
ncbi:MAG TPA: threonine/serine dehydratase [Streptosporangiaceae bacterium]|nr:threonine/serine dehydratase [Streptosporangiaceae bacterium]